MRDLIVLAARLMMHRERDKTGVADQIEHEVKPGRHRKSPRQGDKHQERRFVPRCRGWDLPWNDTGGRRRGCANNNPADTSEDADGAVHVL
jgi:hypothetical protein